MLHISNRFFRFQMLFWQKNKKILIAGIMAVIMLSTVIFVSAFNVEAESTYASLSTDEWELQAFDSFSEYG